MKYNVELLKADILDELDKINRIMEEFVKLEDKLELPAGDVPMSDRAAIGYYLHNFYNGAESIFRNIAKFFENDLDPQTWHSDLLKRMRISITGFRPAVIDNELFLILNDFRGFRHKFRHCYSFELDWERQGLVARKFHKALDMLNEQIRDFLRAIEKMDAN